MVGLAHGNVSPALSMQSGTAGCQAAAKIEKDTAAVTLADVTPHMTGVVKVTTWSLVRTCIFVM